MNDTLYFGCVGEAGHYLWRPDGERLRMRQHPLEHLDTGFCPAGAQHEGRAVLHHRDGWTVLAFWDRSVDRRPGSHSTFLARGSLDFDAMVAATRAAFPHVWARYKFPVVPA